MTINADNLKSKAGPLPIWAWSLIAGGVLILVFLYLRGRSQVNAASPTATTATDPYAAFQNYSAAPTSVTPTDQGASGSYETNQSWLSKAVTWLTSQNVADPLDAQAALNSYLNLGQPLDPASTKIVNAALNQFGLPPEPVYGTPTGTTAPAASANPTVQSYIRNPNGSISVVFNNNTKGEFNNLSKYQAFSAKHPAGPWQQVTQDAYAAIPTAMTNPDF